jgi:hypothetical protein
MKAILTLALGYLLAISFAHAGETTFVEIFDGKSLEGWEGAVEGYTANNKWLVCREGATGNLMTKKEYSDFELRFEFMVAPDANNGLAIRSPLEGDAAYVGMELQIIDNNTKKYGELKDYQYHGSLYGVAPAKRGFQKPSGVWNDQHVLCQGRHIKVTLNGTVILDVDLDKVAPEGKTIDGKDHPGLARKSGRIGFLSHGDRVAFRNIRIRDLSSASSDKAKE